MKLIFSILRSLNPVRTDRLIVVNYRTTSKTPDGVNAHGEYKRIPLLRQMLVSVTETTFVFGWNVHTKNTNLIANEVVHGEFETRTAIVREEIKMHFPWACEFFEKQLEKVGYVVEPDNPENRAYFTDYYTTT